MAQKPDIDEVEPVIVGETEPVEPKVRRCFIIAPIGDGGSDIRKRSDDVMNYIIKPALKECGYEDPIRADNMPAPGQITRQIIETILNADMVVADLTGHNANVFYELAIRHAAKKPVVQIMLLGEKLPFDVAVQRTIFYSHTDLHLADEARRAIIGQIQSAEANPGDVDSPITQAILVDSLRASSDPVAQGNAEIIAALQQIQSRLGVIESTTFPGINRINPDQPRRLADMYSEIPLATMKQFHQRLMELIPNISIQESDAALVHMANKYLASTPNMPYERIVRGLTACLSGGNQKPYDMARGWLQQIEIQIPPFTSLPSANRPS